VEKSKIVPLVTNIVSSNVQTWNSKQEEPERYL
jgi:hypothetical protein